MILPDVMRFFTSLHFANNNFLQRKVVNLTSNPPKVEDEASIGWDKQYIGLCSYRSGTTSTEHPVILTRGNLVDGIRCSSIKLTGSYQYPLPCTTNVLKKGKSIHPPITRNLERITVPISRFLSHTLYSVRLRCGLAGRWLSSGAFNTDCTALKC
jgi:hypothetical protein